MEIDANAIDSVFAKLDQMEVDNDIHTESSVNSPNNYAKPESFKHRVDDISIKVEKVIVSSLLLFDSDHVRYTH